MEFFQAGKVAVGYDVRLSSPALAAALVRGLAEGGCDVIELGLCGTEQVYFAAFHLELDGGVSRQQKNHQTMISRWFIQDNI
ncbi:hypothetical protein [Desulfoscipio geothermicus]|uniref:hypothetical protein n=1 Tax=Desulfoscipio geothermicus TaxID=39060 RepID=UPI000A4D3FCD|nr:hypothetical protein [Desulfoscipio geothermicus]